MLCNVPLRFRGGDNMVVWKVRSCPRCGGDTFLDMDGATYYDHCLQCGYLSKDRHASTSKEYQHITYLVTSSDAMSAGWTIRKTMDRKPGRPKGSKDKIKRHQRRSVLN